MLFQLMKYFSTEDVAHSSYRKHPCQSAASQDSLHSLLQNLESAVHSKKKKNVEILRLSAAVSCFLWLYLMRWRPLSVLTRIA